MMTNQTKNSYTSPLFGILFTSFVAFCGFLLAKLPGLHFIGPLACAIILAILYRQFFGYPESLRTGIQFSAKTLLRLAIILYGLKLNIGIILQEGLGLLALDAIVIILSIALMIWLGKLMKADGKVSFLLGVGTGVCGAAAIAAVSPIMKADEEETAVSVGMIALVGTAFSIVYTLLYPLLPLSAVDYGIWSGMSLHELAHVALAAERAGQDGLAIALLAKLGRVFLLVPLCFVLIYWMRRKQADNTEKAKIEYPWFLIGFIIMSFFGSYVLGHYIPVSDTVMSGLSTLTTFILTMAMVGLGLNVSLKTLRTKALRPLIAMIITSFMVSVITLFLNM